MITEQELKDRCTPEFIKWMCEYAEGFIKNLNLNVYDVKKYLQNIKKDNDIFALLVHRTIDGWNKKHFDAIESIFYEYDEISYGLNKYPMPDFFKFKIKDYESNNLTQAECAMLHCLLDVFKKQEERYE